MHKILPVSNERWAGRSKIKNAANRRKTACSGAFGVPDTTRTCDPGLRRLVLYPTELLGHISKIFNFPAQTDSNELPLRRLVLYPTELLGHISKIFNFPAQTDSNELPLRRRTLYPPELRRHIYFVSIAEIPYKIKAKRRAHRRTSLFSRPHFPAQSKSRPPQEPCKPLRRPNILLILILIISQTVYSATKLTST